ncbi:MAG TPA: MFS transporter, partial [Gemmataceae bacterium]|nr:MFS transporter [Gemmataceae bacterium]
MNSSAADSGESPSENSHPPASVHSHYRWYIVGMLWCISFFNYADRQAIYSVFPLLEGELKLSKFDLGLLGSAFAWVYALSAPAAGYVVDRFRRKTAILAGLQAWSLICMATGLAQKFWQLVFFRAAEGLGETFYYPASVSMISDYHGKKTRSRALGLHQTSVYAGTIGGGIFAAWIGQHFGWRWSFIVFGGLGIGLGLVLHRFLREPKRGGAEFSGDETSPRLPTVQVLQLIWGKPTVIALMLAFLCAMFTNMVLLTWMSTYIFNRFDLTLPEATLIATAFPHVASMLGSPLGGWLADSLRQRWNNGRVMVQVMGIWLGAPFVYLCGLDYPLLGIMAILASWGFFKGIYGANIYAS